MSPSVHIMWSMASFPESPQGFTPNHFVALTRVDKLLESIGSISNLSGMHTDDEIFDSQSMDNEVETVSDVKDTISKPDSKPQFDENQNEYDSFISTNEVSSLYDNSSIDQDDVPSRESSVGSEMDNEELDEPDYGDHDLENLVIPLRPP